MPRPILLAAVAGFLCAACGPKAPPDAAGTPAISADAAPASLLVRAASGMHDGKLAAKDHAEILASQDPAHGRARRVLTALVADLDAGRGADVHEEDESGEETAGPKLVIPAGAATAEVRRDDVRAPTGKTASAAPAPGKKTSPAPAEAARALVTGFRFREGKGSDVLFTVKASGGVSIGLANQRRSGIVRLVVDSAGALPAVLGARPAFRGAAVTAVSKATSSVFITLTLEPGWSVVSLKRVPGGARVVLRPEGA